MTVTTVVAINRRAILLVYIISYYVCSRFMYMVSNNLMLVIGLVKLVRVSDCCK
jgi:hypothetical protein